MDDHLFDESIKRKVGNYEETAFDPASLAALHHQMAGMKTWPWYSRYRTELIVSSGLVLSTLFIVFSQWFLSKQYGNINESSLLELRQQNQQITEMQKKIEYLMTRSPDTVKIEVVNEQSSTLYLSLLDRIKSLEAALNHFNEQSAQDPAQHSNISGLRTDSTTAKQWSGEQDLYESSSARLSPRNKISESVQALPMVRNHADPSSRQLSVKTTRELEKHYRNGIGIRLGPTIELSKGIYPEGNGGLDITGGVLADVIVAPALSLETGIKYIHRFYEVSDITELSRLSLPGVDDDLGTLMYADIDSWMFELPLNLKYRYPLSMTRHLLAGLGYSSLLYSKQVFEYGYQVENNPYVSLTSDFKSSEFRFYPGAVNISLGFSNQLKNRKILETAIYYQHSLGKLGQEGTRPAFLGVKAVYWFSIR